MKELLVKPAIGLALFAGAPVAEQAEARPAFVDYGHHIVNCMRSAARMRTEGVEGRALIFKSNRSVDAALRPVDAYEVRPDCRDVKMRRYTRVQVLAGKQAISRAEIVMGPWNDAEDIVDAIPTDRDINSGDETLTGRFTTIVRTDSRTEPVRMSVDVPMQAAAAGEQPSNDPYPNCEANGYATSQGHCIDIFAVPAK